MPEKDKQLLMQPIGGQPSGLKPDKKSKKSKLMLKVICVIGAIVGSAIISVVLWFNAQLSPVSTNPDVRIKITIALGSTSGQIGKQLEGLSIIRSAKVFDLFVRITGKNNSLQAGSYRLSPTDSTPDIVTQLIDGQAEQFSVTFYPGATLVDNSDKPLSEKYDVTNILLKAGYSNQEIATALNKTYSSPLFVGKPAGTDLEGYIYGETYNFNVGSSVEDILQKTFDEFYSVIQEKDLINGFLSHDLTLYQGITLASIVQREANSAIDQKQVAQVFYSRLSIGMTLGSDVTWQYIDDKTGVVSDYNLDSPYNTRRYAGLPPGPISVPGISALQAVAEPASTDYLYFLSDSSGKLYFAYTNAEHEANIVNYCKENCI
jgi:UPF0755 protein